MLVVEHSSIVDTSTANAQPWLGLTHLSHEPWDDSVKGRSLEVKWFAGATNALFACT